MQHGVQPLFLVFSTCSILELIVNGFGVDFSQQTTERDCCSDNNEIKKVSSSSDTQQHALAIDSPTTPPGLRYWPLCWLNVSAPPGFYHTLIPLGGTHTSRWGPKVQARLLGLFKAKSMVLHICQDKVTGEDKSYQAVFHVRVNLYFYSTWFMSVLIEFSRKTGAGCTLIDVRQTPVLRNQMPCGFEPNSGIKWKKNAFVCLSLWSQDYEQLISKITPHKNTTWPDSTSWSCWTSVFRCALLPWTWTAVNRRLDRLSRF